VISKRIKYQIHEGKIFICEFVDGGSCFAEEYKMEKSDRPLRKVTFILTKEVEKEFGKIDTIKCALLEKEEKEKHYNRDNCFRSNVCLEDKYVLSFKNGNKVWQPNGLPRIYRKHHESHKSPGGFGGCPFV
jgi:hypothetical protein